MKVPIAQKLELEPENSYTWVKNAKPKLRMLLSIPWLSNKN